MLGQEDYDKLRPLSYPHTNIFLLFFSIASKVSFKNIKERWISEIRHFAPNTPIILIGTMSDLRFENTNFQLVSKEEGVHLAREIGAISYKECSAISHEGLKEIFDEAIKTALEKSYTKDSQCCTIM